MSPRSDPPSGHGVASAYHTAGANGLDGLCRITADGILHIHTGVGDLGTYSYASTWRVAAEVPVDISGIADLHGIREKNGGLYIGAMTTPTEVATSDLVRAKFPLLADAADRVASPRIHAGTIGGNAAQDTRCPYCRSGLPCYRAGGNTCYANPPIRRAWRANADRLATRLKFSPFSASVAATELKFVHLRRGPRCQI